MAFQSHIRTSLLIGALIITTALCSCRMSYTTTPAADGEDDQWGDTIGGVPGGVDDADSGGDAGGDDGAPNDLIDNGEDDSPPDDGGDDPADNDDPADGSVALRYFPDEAPWYRDISDEILHDNSDNIIDWLNDNGGFGLGRLQIDFSIEVLEADSSAVMHEFTPTEEWFNPDCDRDAIPIPPGGAIEGEEGYACDNDGDCHLIVVDRANQRLYEMWRAHLIGNQFQGGCLAVWDMSRVYGDNGRGRDCTSADAAGLPIAPLLFTAEEVAAGSVDHAIRFILPNERIRHRVYVPPATHSTGATGGMGYAPPYGARFRLRADFPLDSLPSAAARTVARGLQRYGMILADAGNVALTAQSDRFSTVKWDGLLGSRDLESIQITDFEMIDAQPGRLFTGDCVREP